VPQLARLSVLAGNDARGNCAWTAEVVSVRLKSHIRKGGLHMVSHRAPSS
jgi:hypothetical protein